MDTSREQQAKSHPEREAEGRHARKMVVGLLSFFYSNVTSVPDGFVFEHSGKADDHEYKLCIGGCISHALAGPWTPTQALALCKNTYGFLATMAAQEQQRQGVTPG